VLVVAEARVKPAGVLLGLAVGSIAGWAVVISSVSFIWVAPAASAATIAAAHLLGRPATGRSSRVGQPPSTR
jgi:hypothetical protein